MRPCKKTKNKKKGSKGGTDVDNEAAELELFGCDDVMVTRLLGQLHDSATRSEPQTRHVRLAVETETVETGEREC